MKEVLHTWKSEVIINGKKGRDCRLVKIDGKIYLQAHYLSDINPDPESHWLPPYPHETVLQILQEVIVYN